MTARLPHRCLTQVIVVLPEVATFLENRSTLDRWQPRGKDPQRLAAGVHLDCRDACPMRRWLPARLVRQWVSVIHRANSHLRNGRLTQHKVRALAHWSASRRGQTVSAFQTGKPDALRQAKGQLFRIGVEGVVAAWAAHTIGGCGRVCYQVYSSRVSGLVRKPPMLALVDGATASAAGQIAVRVFSVPSHQRCPTPSSEGLKTPALPLLLLLLFRGALLLQRFCRLLLRLPLPVQTLAHDSLPCVTVNVCRAPSRYANPRTPGVGIAGCRALCPCGEIAVSTERRAGLPQNG